MLEFIPILFFNGDGRPCYRGQDLDGHIWYDYCTCEAYEDARFDDDDDRPRKRKSKAKSSQKLFKEKYEGGDLVLNFLGESFGKFDLYVIY